jgi:hypothetical protein
VDGSEGGEPCLHGGDCNHKCRFSLQKCLGNGDCPKSCTETGETCATHLDCSGEENLCLLEECLASECTANWVCAPLPPKEPVWVDLCSEARNLLTGDPGPDWAPWW